MQKNTFFTNLKSLLFFHGWLFMSVVLLFLVMLLTTLTPNGIYFWVVVGGMLLFLVPWFRYIDTSAVFILLFGVFYGIFSVILKIPYSVSYLASCFLVPLPLYCLGRWFANRLKGQDNQFITLIFLSLLCISFVLLYRAVIDVSQSGVVSMKRTFEIEGVETISATLYGMYAAVTMVGLPMFFASTQKRTLQSWLFLILSVLGLLATFHLINRTGLVIAVFATFIGAVYRSRANIGRYILILGFVVLAIYALIATEIIPAEVIEVYRLRNEESERLGMSAGGGRADRWLDAVGRIFYMPFGWYHQQHITGYSFVHNWWLDVGRVMGIIPFLLLLIPTIISIKNCIKLFKEKNKEVNLLLLSLNVCLFLGTFVEPVMEGSITIAYFYMFVWGLTSQVANGNKKPTRNTNKSFLLRLN